MKRQTNLRAAHSYSRKLKISLLMGLSIVLASGSALAQSNAISSADQIRARAAKLKELRDLLGDREPSIRMAAFSELINSPDPMAQEMGFEAGFSSSDSAIRAMALRKRLMRMSAVSLTITEASAEWLTKIQKEGRPNPMQTSFGWNVASADESSGTLKFSDRRNFNSEEVKNIQSGLVVSGQSISITTRGYKPECDGTLTLDDTNVVSGRMSCWLDHLAPGAPIFNKVLLKVTLRVH